MKRGVVDQFRWVAGEPDTALIRAALDCVRVMRFYPALRGGVPVVVWCRQRFDVRRDPGRKRDSMKPGAQRPRNPPSDRAGARVSFSPSTSSVTRAAPSRSSHSTPQRSSARPSPMPRADVDRAHDRDLAALRMKLVAAEADASLVAIREHAGRRCGIPGA